MVASNLVLIASAGGMGRTVLDQLRAQDVPVRAMVRRDDDRAAELRALGAEVVVGDLTRPENVAAALEGVGRMYFAMPVSPDHLLATTVVATVAREHGELDALVGMSQMTVSQMTATSTGGVAPAAAALAGGAGTELVGPARGPHPADVVPGQSAVHHAGGPVDPGERHDRAAVRHRAHVAGRRGRRRPGGRHRAPRPGSARRARVRADRATHAST